MSLTRRLLSALLLTLLCSQALAALEASIDRTRLVEGETLELTLESSSANRFSRLDLDALEEHFLIQGTRQLSLVTQLDGRSQPVTRWVITLIPKRTGFVVIPPIRLNDQQSEPISLHVISLDEAANDNSIQLAPVFIDSEVDNPSPYVQAQTLLTLRIYHSVPLFDDANLTELVINDAKVERLGPPRNYERVINGVRHGVREERYAIFAQVSGNLEIPSQLFSATTMPQRDQSSAIARNGRLVQLRSPSINLDVQPIPAAYPSNAPWIPARQLRVEQNWQPDPTLDLLTGESLTRSMRIQAEGLPAALLPDLAVINNNRIKGVRQYADQPKLDNIIHEDGLRSLRQDSAALLVQEAGRFELPAQNLFWWNTVEDSLQVIELPAVTLTVINSDSFVSSQAPLQPGTDPDLVDTTLLWPWQLASALLSLALLASLYGLYRTRQNLLRLLKPDQDEEIFDTSVVQGNPLGDLQSACRSNQPAEARKALELWARQQDPEGLIGLAQRHIEIADALEGLNTCLFGQNEYPWRGKPLWRAVRMVIQSQKQVATSDSPVNEGLYPEV